MCQVILKPAGVEMPDGWLEKARRLNPNGWGVAATCNDGSLFVMKNNPLVTKFTSNAGGTELWHFRFSLSGVDDLESTQPFTKSDEYAWTHVGVLKDWSTLGPHSDSYNFWQECSDLIVASHWNAGYKRMLQAYCNVTQNRMVLLSQRGRYWIFGEQNGFWQDGCWLSGVLE